MAVRTDSVAACRSRFPIFERLTYVNSCSQGALSDSVRAAPTSTSSTGWDDRGAPWDYWVERSESARAAFARLVNGRPDDVAVTTSRVGRPERARELDRLRRSGRASSSRTSSSRRSVRSGMPRSCAAPRSCTSRPTGNEIPLERFEAAIDERTAVVSITAVCYRNGARLPVEEIARIAHERGALVVLDAYQAVGTYPLDVSALGVDVAHRRRPQVPARLRRPRLHVDGARPRRGAAADPDRLVRRPRHLRDGHPTTTRRRRRRGGSSRARRRFPRSMQASPGSS